MDIIELLKKLVSIPSVNPDHTDRPEIANEYRVANFLVSWLTARGFQVERDDVSPERGNVIASFGPEYPKQTVLFEAHMDTVGVADMVIPPFDPVVCDGRLYGRGACDTKGPMAAALSALQPPLLDQLSAAGIRVVFVGAYGEEKGNLGAERLVDQGIQADAIIILEPTDLAIVHAHKGACWFDVEVTGRAAHGSDPEKGISAIFAMASILDWLKKQIASDQSMHRHPDLGVPTLSVGRIEGGIATNIVPHRCRIAVDRRTVPGEDNSQILATLGRYLEELKASGAVQDFRVTPDKVGAPFWTEPNATLTERFAQSIQACGGPTHLATAAWYSDAAAFARTGAEVIIFGPGGIAQAHTVDEWIDLAELQRGEEVIRHYLEQLIVEASDA